MRRWSAGSLYSLPAGSEPASVRPSRTRHGHLGDLRSESVAQSAQRKACLSGRAPQLCDAPRPGGDEVELLAVACGIQRPEAPVVPAASRARDDAATAPGHLLGRVSGRRSSSAPTPVIPAGTHPRLTVWLPVPSQTRSTVVSSQWCTPPTWRVAAGDAVSSGLHLLCGVGAKQWQEQGPQRRERDRHGRGPGRNSAEKRDVDCTGR